MRTALLTLGILAALDLASAGAQTCTGAASFRDHPMQVAGSMATVNSATDIGGTFLASRRAVFGGGGASISDPDFGSTVTSVLGVVGVEFADPDHPAFFCPIGRLQFGNGPDFDPLDGSSFVTHAGVSVGLRVWEARNATVIPTFSLLAVYERYRAEFGGVESSSSIGSGLLTFGVGIVFDNRFAVVPAVQVPFSRGASSAGFAWTASWNFGG